MSRKTWTAVDNYIAESLLEADPVLDAALKANSERGLPAIDVSPAQGKLLNLLVRMSGAKRILEIGRSAAIRRSGLRARCRLAARS